MCLCVFSAVQLCVCDFIKVLNTEWKTPQVAEAVGRKSQQIQSLDEQLKSLSESFEDKSL